MENLGKILVSKLLGHPAQSRRSSSFKSLSEKYQQVKQG
jgi:hypothetical protein